jgi:hypothetical protein
MGLREKIIKGGCRGVDGIIVDFNFSTDRREREGKLTEIMFSKNPQVDLFV